MELLESKTTSTLLASLLAEIAKATNELKCSQRDTAKAASRLQFAVLALNELLARTETD